MTSGSLISVLTTLEQVLRQRGAPVVELLRPPRDVPPSLDILGGRLALSRQVRDLYAWHDGTQDVGGAAYTLFPFGWWFPPFEKALEILEIRLDGYDPESDSDWSPTWFPVLSSGMDALAVDCSEVVGPVWDAALSTGGTAEIVAASLQSLVERIIARYESGDFLVDDGRVELADESLYGLDLLKS